MTSLWKTHRTLTAVSVALLAALPFLALGIVVDSRTIAGAPAWLKPAKFAASLGIYGLTLVWAFRFLPDWPRVRRAGGTITAVVALIEVGLITLQAGRGTTSHFNVGTPFDAAVFGTMGTAILIQWIASIAIAVALWRQRFEDRALASALRTGMALAVAGAAIGGMMTRPTPAQIAEARATHHMTVSGAHSIGGSDGGPGIPVTKWSSEHGDLRVAHFLGLHALQMLPLLALGLARMRPRFGDDDRLYLVRVAAGSYAALTVVLLWQALRGQSIVAPDPLTLAVLAAWMAVTALAAGLPFRRRVMAVSSVIFAAAGQR